MIRVGFADEPFLPDAQLSRRKTLMEVADSAIRAARRSAVRNHRSAPRLRWERVGPATVRRYTR